MRELRRAYPGWEFDDENEEARLESIRMRKMRGKGAPKKRKAEGMWLHFTVTLVVWLTFWDRFKEAAETKTGWSEIMSVVEPSHSSASKGD